MCARGPQRPVAPIRPTRKGFDAAMRASCDELRSSRASLLRFDSSLFRDLAESSNPVDVALRELVGTAGRRLGTDVAHFLANVLHLERTRDRSIERRDDVGSNAGRAHDA